LRAQQFYPLVRGENSDGDIGFIVFTAHPYANLELYSLSNGRTE
jgi:hypothetical protein